MNTKLTSADLPEVTFSNVAYQGGTNISGIKVGNDEYNFAGGTVSEWGDITGTLSNQTDLQNALDAKANASSLNAIATKGIQSSNDSILIDSTDTPIDLVLNGQQSFQTTQTVSDIATFTGRVNCSDYGGVQMPNNPLIAECVIEGIEGSDYEGLFRDSMLNVNSNGTNISMQSFNVDGTGYDEGIAINRNVPGGLYWYDEYDENGDPTVEESYGLRECLAKAEASIDKDVNNLTYYTKTADQPSLTLSTLAYNTQYNLRGIELGGVEYNVLTNVEANPQTTATETLSKVTIGGVTYDIGGGSTSVTTDTAQVITGTKTIAGTSLKFRTAGNAQTNYGGDIISSGSGSISLVGRNNDDVSVTLSHSSGGSTDRFYPSVDNQVDLGDSYLGTNGLRFKNLYLAGNLSDGTNSISIANIASKTDLPSYTNTDGNISINNGVINLAKVGLMNQIADLGDEGELSVTKVSSLNNPSNAYQSALITYMKEGIAESAYDGYSDIHQLQVGYGGVNAVNQVANDPDNPNIVSCINYVSTDGYGTTFQVSQTATSNIETNVNAYIGELFKIDYSQLDYSQYDPEDPASEPTVITDKSYNVLDDLDLAENSVQLSGDQTITGAKTFTSWIEMRQPAHATDANGGSIVTAADGIGLAAKLSGSSTKYLNFNNLGSTGKLSPYPNNAIDLGTSTAKFKNGYFAGNLSADYVTSRILNPYLSLGGASAYGAYYDRTLTNEDDETGDTEYVTTFARNAIRIEDTSEDSEEHPYDDDSPYTIGIPLVSGQMVVAMPPTSAGTYTLKCTSTGSGAVTAYWQRDN